MVIAVHVLTLLLKQHDDSGSPESTLVELLPSVQDYVEPLLNFSIIEWPTDVLRSHRLDNVSERIPTMIYGPELSAELQVSDIQLRRA